MYEPVIKTDELQKLDFLGKITPEQKDLLERRREQEKEINDGRKYWRYMKDTCQRCGAPIPKSWSHYKNFGNFCKQQINCKLRYLKENDAQPTQKIQFRVSRVKNNV